MQMVYQAKNSKIGNSLRATRIFFRSERYHAPDHPPAPDRQHPGGLLRAVTGRRSGKPVAEVTGQIPSY